MRPEAIKLVLRELLTEAEKVEVDLRRHNIDLNTWRADHPGQSLPDELQFRDDDLVKPFQHLAVSLFLTTVCLLDALGLHEYLRQFHLRFGETFDASTAASEYETDLYWSGEAYNVFLANLRQFLVPLNILEDKSRYLKLSGIQYLETILRNTATIVHKTGKPLKTEAEIYKEVRKVLEVVFPTAISPRSNFFKTAQEYKPDVLIPELSAAVEYKYAESESKLKATIAQISDDVKGYSGDHDYNLFYAIFYVSEDFWGQDKFNAAWSEKEFPINWRAFYVVGT